MSLMMRTSNRIPKTYPSDEEEYSMSADTVVKYVVPRNRLESLPEKDMNLLISAVTVAMIGDILGNDSLTRLGWSQAAQFMNVPEDFRRIKDAYETSDGNLVIEFYASREEDKSQC